MAEAIKLGSVDEGRAEDGRFALEEIHEELEVGEVRISCRFLVKDCTVETADVLDRSTECLGDHLGVEGSCRGVEVTIGNVSMNDSR